MAIKYWQIAAGSAGRDYSELFLKFGLAFVGGESQITTMRGVSAGDVIILKSGLHKILAAGRVVDKDGICGGCGDKEWLRDFDGWDLPAYCYVDWHIPKKPVETDGLTRATIQRVHQVKHKSAAEELLGLVATKPAPEPEVVKAVTDEIILEFLISQGLRPSAADELTNTFRRIRLLANYYYNQCRWADIREHETRTFLVVPLLLALGWAEQQLKIELPAAGGRVDLACFSAPYNSGQDDCLILIETKDFSSGLDYAPKQARQYAKAFSSCRVLVVTNGYCYKTFLPSKSGGFNRQPSAYLNLLRPRDRYPLNPTEVDGALEALRCLLPMTLK